MELEAVGASPTLHADQDRITIRQNRRDHMGHVRCFLALTLGAMSVLVVPAAVFAQAEWLSPTLGQATFRGDVRETYYPDTSE